MKTSQYISKLFPLMAFLLGIWYFCIRLLGYHLEYIPGDLGDSRFINFLLEHGHRWLNGDDKFFWDAGFMFPCKHSIAFSDNMLGTMPIYSFWRVFGFCQETSYQLWWICICTLNYFCSFYVFKKWFKNSEVAVILAWIFAFSIFNLGQLNYMQMIVRFMVPIVFYSAYRLIDKPSTRYLALYCFGVVFQFYCVLYTGFYLFYFSLLFIFLYSFLSKKWGNLAFYIKKENLLITSLALIFSVTALLWLMIPYLNMSKVVGLRLYNDVTINLPVWKSFLFPHESSISWRIFFDHFKPKVKEWWLHYLFIGLIPFLVLVFSPAILLWNNINKTKTSLVFKTLIISSLIIMLLHFRTEKGLSLYALIFKFPGINSMRVLIRFMHVELFILLLILGYLLMKIKMKHLLFFALLVFTDNLFTPEKVPRQHKKELIERKTRLMAELKMHDYHKYKAVALIDTALPSYIVHLDMMLVSQLIGIETVNAYSSSCPDAFGNFFKSNSVIGLRNWLENQRISEDEILVINRNRK